MQYSWITALLNSILPRHPRAESARNVSTRELVAVYAPTTLPRASWIHVLFPYREPNVRALVQAVKYYGERSVVEKLAPFASDYILELIAHQTQFEGWELVTITPVPASPKRLRERGYNQAALFARAIAKLVPDASYDESLLTREERPSQVHIGRNRRKANMAGAFTASARAATRFVILIDDVVESGATLTDARRALRTAGAKGVIALAIAH